MIEKDETEVKGVVGPQGGRPKEMMKPGSPKKPANPIMSAKQKAILKALRGK
jgi:hypothetical protein